MYKKRPRKYHAILFLMPFFMLCAGCSQSAGQLPAETTPVSPFSILEAEPILTPPPGETIDPTPTPKPTPMPEVTLMALGDDLLHPGIFRKGFMEDGTRNYDFLFADLADFIEAADVSVINQETIFGGNDLGFSGYPYFNSPTEVGDAMIKVGFDVVLQATNHTLDQKQAGAEHALNYWKQHPEILMVGYHDRYEKEDGTPMDVKDCIPILTVNGIRLAILNYTYGPNYEILPQYARGRLDMLCDWNEKNGAIQFTNIHPRVLEEIQAAEELADFVIVFPHWGTEYSTKVSTTQKKFAKQMTEAGADLIIGAHPHVIEPVEWITADNGNESLCYYSLGNYVSTQQDPINVLENMAWVTLQRTADGTVVIDRERTGSIPIVCQYTYGPLRFNAIYLLEEYTQEIANKHGIRQWGHHNLYVDDLWTWTNEILGDSVKPAHELTGLR